jgi:CHAT domain-containing protein
MMPSNRIGCEMVEFHRFGGERAQLLCHDNEYIRTTGYDEPASVVRPSVDQERSLDLIYQLRYQSGVTQGEVQAAQAELGGYATAFLPSPPSSGDRLMQIDLVTNAAELWAFPFEACYAVNPAWLASTDRGVVLTRRIRGGFSDDTLPWPDQPRVLFAHAPPAVDLPKSLIDQHEKALRAALEPWSRGRAADENLLRVKDVASLNELARARIEFKPTYVHLLAHGAQTEVNKGRPKPTWGLRLGYPGEAGVPPADIAKVLAPEAGVPLVTTLAACDSANQTELTYANYSLAQELHRLGVPVVVASQFPLTFPGSVVMAGEFYRYLLEGEDVRGALHAARVALRGDANAGHDWLSLVGYVRLPPEGYAKHLAEFGLRAELGMLDAQQKRADHLSLEGGEADEFDEVETQLRKRIAALIARRKDLDGSGQHLVDELQGLLASANKRLAELLFNRAEKLGDRRDLDLRASREALAESLNCYRTGYRRNIQNHWSGIQVLALEAALRARFENPGDWQIVRRAAELERDAKVKDFWTCGTLAECYLLAPIAGASSQIEAAEAALNLLRERAKGNNDEQFAIGATRRQLNRYVTWWTNANKFFPGVTDLSKDARRLADRLA